MACLKDSAPLLDCKLKCLCSANGEMVCPCLPLNRRDYTPSEVWTFSSRCFARLKMLSLYFPTASPSLFCLLTLVPHCWTLKNWCFWTVVLKNTLESPLDCKEIQQVNPKGNKLWIFIGRTDAEAEKSNTLATWCKELTHWKRPWCWERLKAGGEEDDRGWDGWMASLMWKTWVWVGSRSWWWTGNPGVLQSIGLQRVRHD